jgi:hypothetical protein
MPNTKKKSKTLDPTSAKVTAMMKSVSDAYEINQFQRNKLIRTITATNNVCDVPACVDAGIDVVPNARECQKMSHFLFFTDLSESS